MRHEQSPGTRRKPRATGACLLDVDQRFEQMFLKDRAARWLLDVSKGNRSRLIDEIELHIGRAAEDIHSGRGRLHCR
jgi:hypothetical protein